MKPARSPQETATLPTCVAQRADGLGDVVGGGDRGDDLDQLHDRRRVEEVHADDVLRPLRSPVAQRDDRQRRRGGGQDRAGLADLVEVLEQRRLDLRGPRRSPRPRGRRRARSSSEVVPVSRPSTSSLGRLLELAALDRLVERALDGRRGRRRPCPGARPTYVHVVPGLGEDLDDAGGHGAGADHADRARCRGAAAACRRRDGVWSSATTTGLSGAS